jgi:hypothetical protein
VAVQREICVSSVNLEILHLAPQLWLPRTHLVISFKILHLAPLTPQVWGEPESQSPPELGDLGG